MSRICQYGNKHHLRSSGAHNARYVFLLQVRVPQTIDGETWAVNKLGHPCLVPTIPKIL